MERLALLFLRVLQVNKAYVAQICQGKALSILDGCTVGMADARTRTKLFLGEHAVVIVLKSLGTSCVLYPKVAY